MTTDADIRTWAKEAGVTVPARGKVPEDVRTAYAEAHTAGDNLGLSSDEPAGGHAYAEAETVPTRPQGHPEEVAPLPPPGRLSGLRRRGPAAVREKKTHKRVSLESLAEGAWGLLANLTASRGLIPTARALDLQAPVAGMILEDALRGTVADRIAQPIARAGDAGREIYALLGVPVMVTVMTLRPDGAPSMVPQLKKAMREWAIVAGPRIKAKKRREERALEQMGIEDVAGLDALVDEWMAGLFAPVPGAPHEAADGG